MEQRSETRRPSSFADDRLTDPLSLSPFPPVIALIETSLIRNLPHAQLTLSYTQASAKHLPLSSSTARKSVDLALERRRDAVGHFVLRLAFCGSDELRKRFVRAERELFRLRYESDDREERRRFIESLNLSWNKVRRVRETPGSGRQTLTS